MNNTLPGQRSRVRLTKFRSAIAHYLTQPLVHLLARTPITPNAITCFGFIIAIGAATLVTMGNLLVAGCLVLISGFFDVMDGALARHTNKVTRFGGILDSVLDRVAEAIVLLGILVLYAKEQSITGVLLIGLTLLSSFLVSYIRARAEALKLECNVGLFTRTERVVVLAMGLLLNQFFNSLFIALVLIVIFSFFTFGQRLFFVWQQTKK
ncbi:CDP-alcohol phosphatidyltransferase family protein [Chloroflexota bacterium]